MSRRVVIFVMGTLIGGSLGWQMARIDKLDGRISSLESPTTTTTTSIVFPGAPGG